MRHIIKLVLVVAIAAGFGVVFPPVLGAAFHDALLDFLDEQTASQVMDYFNRTSVPRALGIIMLLLFWAAIVATIDRLVDLAARPRSTGNR